MEETGNRLDRETKRRLLSERIEELEGIVDVLKEIRDNPNIGEMGVCSKHGIHWERFRRYVYETQWHKKSTKLVPPENELLETLRTYAPTMSWYDRLWCTVTGKKMRSIVCTPTDLAETFEYLFKTVLTPREVKVIRMRYQENMVLEEAGKELGVTRERIAAIERRAIRKLRHSAAWLIYGKHELIPVLKIQRDLEKDVEVAVKYKILSELNGEIPNLRKLILKGIGAVVVERNQKEKSISPETVRNGKIDIMDISLEDLDFSVRTHGLLARRGVETLLDIVSMTESELMKTRQLGRKSYEEIIEKLTMYGVHLRPEDEDYY